MRHSGRPASVRTGMMIALAALVAAAGCREALEPFSPANVTPDTTGPLRLTYSPGNDMYPTWSADGERVLYSGAGFPGLPSGRGLILSVPRSGGPVDLVFADVQGAGAGGPRWLAGSALNTESDRVAYLDVADVAVPVPTDTLACMFPEPLLDSAVLRIRRRGETGSILDDPAFPFRFGGRDAEQGTGAPGSFTMHAFPFQLRFISDALIGARASWSPDGRVAFADGLTLWLWNVDGAQPGAVPGVTDASTAAWSPDGEWIAYSRLERGASRTETCDVARGPTLVARHTRTTYDWPRTFVALVRPDGSGGTDLTEGSDPAWSPDGQWIYYGGNGRIERVASGGGPAEAIAGTEGGAWPAVSPDGAWVAFMRKDGETWDIWAVPLAR